MIELFILFSYARSGVVQEPAPDGRNIVYLSWILFNMRDRDLLMEGAV